MFELMITLYCLVGLIIPGFTIYFGVKAVNELVKCINGA
jgi:hypothetical protein